MFPACAGQHMPEALDRRRFCICACHAPTSFDLLRTAIRLMSFCISKYRLICASRFFSKSGNVVVLVVKRGLTRYDFLFSGAGLISRREPRKSYFSDIFMPRLYLMAQCARHYISTRTHIQKLPALRKVSVNTVALHCSPLLASASPATRRNSAG